MPSNAQSRIETIENRCPDRHYLVEMECPEFTCLCPKTGQPDFATIRLRYVPDRLLVELKSLKLYLWGFRDRGVFHEHAVNEIGDHLRASLSPRFLEVSADFKVRGGIHTVVRVSWGTLPAGSSLNDPAAGA